MERVNWNQAVRPSTHDLIAAINSGADDIERIDGALDDIETALDGKAGVSGTYPDFVAGEALSIRSGIRSNTFLTRQLDADVADGIAEVQAIKGNTVVWNQLYNLPNNTDTQQGITITRSNGKLTFNGTGTNTSAVGIAGVGVANANGHKYLIHGNMNNAPSGMYFSAQTFGYDLNNTGAIVTSTSANATWYYVFIIPANAVCNNVTAEPIVIDLTTIFGAGNEPTTVAEFEAQYGSDYKPYSAPVLLSSNIAGIEGASSCEFPAQTLRKVETAQDMMTRTGIERNAAEREILSIGTITENPSGPFYWYAGLNLGTITDLNWSSYADFRDQSNVSNTVTEGLGWSDRNATITIQRAWNGVIAYTYQQISRADFEAATAALIGKKIVFARKTATETFAEPLDLTYRVESGGSEAWIVPEDTQSAAVTGEIAYPLDPARALITHESFADFIDKLGAYIGATITETWDGSKYTYSFASGRSALLGSIDAEPDALEVTEKDGMVKEIIEDERKEL